jgi:hypothetical protein
MLNKTLLFVIVILELDLLWVYIYNTYTYEVEDIVSPSFFLFFLFWLCVGLEKKINFFHWNKKHRLGEYI